MPIAAVPNYLDRDFRDASPAMRFGMYLPVWTERADQEAEIRDRANRGSREAEELREHLKRHGMDATIAAWTRRERNSLPGLWAKNEHASRKAWSDVAKLADRDRKLISKLIERQSAAAAVQEGAGTLLRLDALATAPFTTGLGNEHPLENGFAFLNPYGLPYLPGSGVKGVLRQAARELASGQWGETRGWIEEERYPLMEAEGKERRPVRGKNDNPVMLSMLDLLFGRDTPSGESEHVRGALCFWDVIPQIEGDSLMVEIMTPHQTHYYQKGDSPHESGQPNPISFLTVPPKSRFVFHVQCDLPHLQRLAPQLAESGHWKDPLESAFEHAFRWLGFGAKTAVGYGAMQRRGLRETVQPVDPASRETRAGSSAVPAAARSTEDTWPQAKLSFNPGTGEIKASFQGKTTVGVKGKEADALRAALGDRANRLKKDKEIKNVAVRVRIEGSNMITLLALAVDEQ